ncbi:MAG TPA: putative holin [Pseudomonas sp.]|uniref:putative holin n=1 Tax=Pseudomonas sp. TaxID=306 RepID=UPI002B480B96|nr:putative holin [Pseudomonas sp.]HKS12377.1 putative holin [Pseudomonas sp.]
MEVLVTTYLASLLASANIAVEVPAFDGHALFGAFLGAWMVASTRRRLKVWQRLGSLFLSAGVGYLFTPLVLSLSAPLFSSGVAAFVAAVVVIPISNKVMVWLDTAELREIFQRWRQDR